MEQHYQTEKRTFIVLQGVQGVQAVCVRVVSNKGEIDEHHGAIGCTLLGGVDTLSRKEVTDPPRVGQYLVFKFSTESGTGRNKLFSDTTIRKISQHKQTVPITTMIRPSRQTLPGV